MKKMNSTELIQKAKDSFNALAKKGYEWRSFYNGYLIGYSNSVKSDNNSLTFGKAWKRWILPFIKTVVAMFILQTVFELLDIKSNHADFLTGWITCIIWINLRNKD